MKIAALIPDRGDRPAFLENCLRMLERQTVPLADVHIMNEPATSDQPDITYRYRVGYDFLSKKKYDLIAFIENDDYYHPRYIETMIGEWKAIGQPDMIGTTYTIYYHIGLLKWVTLNHYSRSAAMNTLIRPGLPVHWCADSEPYTDLHLWMNCPYIRKQLVTPGVMSLGIKHGVGLCGGRSHVDRLDKYKFSDPDMTWLKERVDAESFLFYKKINENIRSNNVFAGR